MSELSFPRRPSVAIIGAGISGLTCARRLKDAGLRVAVFEKSRGLGGRLATRRPFGREDAMGLDHGAPYAEGLADTAAIAGSSAAWEDAPAGALVGAPGMSDLVRPLAEGMRIERGVEIREVARGEDWLLVDTEDNRHGPFDILVSAIPAPQATRLLGDACPEAAEAVMAPVWTLLLCFDRPLVTDAPPILRPQEGPFSLILRDSAKPGRAPDRDGWVAHARSDWTAERIDEDKADMAKTLSSLFAEAVGVALPEHAYRAAHRWRYATVEKPAGQAFRLSEDGGLGVCGDWRLGPKAGDAARSGALLAEGLIKRLG
ncbi:MAG: FAD-dependent oxidoreductase [Pseudomonadota bacterium]